MVITVISKMWSHMSCPDQSQHCCTEWNQTSRWRAASEKDSSCNFPCRDLYPLAWRLSGVGFTIGQSLVSKFPNLLRGISDPLVTSHLPFKLNSSVSEPSIMTRNDEKEKLDLEKVSTENKPIVMRELGPRKEISSYLSQGWKLDMPGLFLLTRCCKQHLMITNSIFCLLHWGKCQLGANKYLNSITSLSCLSMEPTEHQGHQNYLMFWVLSW